MRSEQIRQDYSIESAYSVILEIMPYRDSGKDL